MNSLFLFPNPSPVETALNLAENHRDSVFLTRARKEGKCYYADTVVVGRDAELNVENLADVESIVCNTFLSLGRIHLDAINIFADRIILVNHFYSSGRTVLKAKEVFASIGCTITGPGDLDIKSGGHARFLSPLLNHRVITEETKMTLTFPTGETQEIVVDQKETCISEDPIDASIRDIRKELERQRAYDLYSLNREWVQSRGLRSILV